MGLLDFLLEVADVLTSESGKKYTASCETFELFEIGTTWRGTARIHGAGNHLETIKMNISNSLTLPDEGTVDHTPRGLLRRDFLKWASENFAYSGNIAKDMIILNEGENCLSVEGYVKKRSDSWKLVSSSADATHYGAFKVYLYDKNGAMVGHTELSHLFLEATRGYVTSVDVTDGF